MDTRVAKRYARALFNAAESGGVIDAVESDLTAIANLFENDQQFKDFLYSPQVGRDEKLSIADTLFSDRVTALTMQVLRLLINKAREAEIPGVLNEYVRLRRERGAVLYAEVVSAEALSDSQVQALTKKLEQQSGRKVEAVFRVDPSLIGGIRVAVGNYVLDGSIRGSFNRLRDTLRRDVLKQS
ncbi:MAG TPA: ATP synthase F1 subunit delta [Fimbriimonadaceae bacterium]|nr:ATP synthase F1 subunit delta [Fimbriimonadaceae bacterium]